MIGRINLQDRGSFENLLAKPDAEYEIGFRLSDENGAGTMKYDDFQRSYNTIAVLNSCVETQKMRE